MNPSADPGHDLARFETLLARCEKRGHLHDRFRAHRELARLYRRHTTQLARARHRLSDPDAVRHLNALCVRAHALLYARHDDEGSLAGRLGRRIPDALARSYLPLVAAWALLAIGCLVGWALVSQNPAAVHQLMPSNLGYSGAMLDELVHDAHARAEFLAPQATPIEQNTLFGSTLFARNTRVGLLAFAAGMLAGLPTLLLQIYNGVIVGALAWVFMRGGTGVEFLAWILPHGIPEFTAIALCAAGGLSLGAAVAAPGHVGRRRALADAFDTALLLILVSVPLFGVAALVESFVRESSLGLGARFAVAAANFAALVGAMIWLRRRSKDARVDRAWLHELNHDGASRDSG